MINRIVLMGRITHDLELRQTPSGNVVVAFSIAVERNFKDQNGEYQTDFINCVAWNKTAEHICRYFSKGRMIALEGNLRTRTYDDKNGTKRYVTEVFVDSVSFTGERVDSPQNGYQNAPQGNYAYQNNAPQKATQRGYGAYQNGGYQQNGGYTNNQPQQNYQQNYGNVQNNMQSNLDDDFDILSDDGVPF